MPAEIINLRRARKARTRQTAEKEAEANRLQFGRTKAEKLKTKAEREQASARLEAHRRSEDRD